MLCLICYLMVSWVMRKGAAATAKGTSNRNRLERQSKKYQRESNVAHAHHRTSPITDSIS